MALSPSSGVSYARDAGMPPPSHQQRGGGGGGSFRANAAVGSSPTPRRSLSSSSSRRSVAEWYRTNVRETMDFYAGCPSGYSASKGGEGDRGGGGGAGESREERAARRVAQEDEGWVRRRLDRRSESLLSCSSSSASAAAVGLGGSMTEGSPSKLRADRSYSAPGLLQGGQGGLPGSAASLAREVQDVPAERDVNDADTYVRMKGAEGESSPERAVKKVAQRAVGAAARRGWSFRRRKRGTGTSAAVTDDRVSGRGSLDKAAQAHEGYVDFGDDDPLPPRRGETALQAAEGEGGEGKGEVEELRLLLRNVRVERDGGKRRHVLRAVLAAMSRGIDVGPLLPEMTLAVETRDMVVKKMAYLFLCNYAESNPDLAQMCTNTLQKDCGSPDPAVRGLALRSLCSLQLPQMVEYVGEPLRKALDDGHPNVRRTAVMSVLKLHRTDPETFRSCNFVDVLYDAIRDPDPLVSANCVRALGEVMPGGRMAVNRAIVTHLLERIDRFDQFDAPLILELLTRYKPEDEGEYRSVVRRLDPLLRTLHSAVFLSTVRALFALAGRFAWGVDDDGKKNDNDQTSSIELRRTAEKVASPLVTHATSTAAAGDYETAHVVLRHVAILADSYRGLFDADYRHFFPRPNEPSYLRMEKVALLPKLVNKDNGRDIAAELAALAAAGATGRREKEGGTASLLLGRLAVRSLGRAARRMASLAAQSNDAPAEGQGDGDDPATGAVDRLLDLSLNLPEGPVRGEAVTALAGLLRFRPAFLAQSSLCLAPLLRRMLRPTADPLALTSALQLAIQLERDDSSFPPSPASAALEALKASLPYRLERLVDSYDDLPSSSSGSGAGVKSALITSTVLLFFRRPAEVRPALGKVLAKGAVDRDDPDARRRAMFCHRMLRSSAGDLNVARKIFEAGTTAPACPDGDFAEEEGATVSSRLLGDLDSFAVVFGAADLSPEWRQTGYGAVDENGESQEDSAAADDAIIEASASLENFSKNSPPRRTSSAGVVFGQAYLSENEPAADVGAVSGEERDEEADGSPDGSSADGGTELEKSSGDVERRTSVESGECCDLDSSNRDNREDVENSSAPGVVEEECSDGSEDGVQDLIQLDDHNDALPTNAVAEQIDDDADVVAENDSNASKGEKCREGTSTDADETMPHAPSEMEEEGETAPSGTPAADGAKHPDATADLTGSVDCNGREGSGAMSLTSEPPTPNGTGRPGGKDESSPSNGAEIDVAATESVSASSFEGTPDSTDNTPDDNDGSPSVDRLVPMRVA